jgi:hypothetical protein
MSCDITTAQVIYEIAMGFAIGILIAAAIAMCCMGVSAFVDISKHIVKRCINKLGGGA